MNKENIDYTEKAFKISDQIMTQNDLKEVGNDEILTDFVSNDYESASSLLEKLSDEERVMKYSDIAKNFNEKESLRKVGEKIRKTKLRRVQIKILKVVSSAIAGVLAISFMLNIIFEDRNQVVHNFQAQPLIPAEIKVPTIIDNLGNVAALEELPILEEYADFSVDVESKRLSYEKIALIEKNQEEIYNELVMPSKFIYTLVLADGSEVIVNAGSKIKYPTHFNDSVRVVELSGEAFFNVAKSDKPFIVKTDKMEIKVYGTKFNVNTYNNKTEAVLLSGSIGARVGSDEILLEPNEMLVYDNANNITVSEVIGGDFIRWIESDFDYRNRNIIDVLKDISRWYGVEINSKVDLSNTNVTLYSSRSEDILSILELIEMSADVKFLNEGGNLYSLIEDL